MTELSVLVVCKSRLIGEVLSETIRKEISAKVIYADSEDAAVELLATLKPSIIVIAHADATTASVDHYFNDYPVKLVVVGLEDEKILICSRSAHSRATVKNFIKAVKKLRKRS
jgi:chemotaxis response regulator CheB